MDLVNEARALAGDRDRGASEILTNVLPLIERAVESGPAVAQEVVRAVLAVQPAMASLWNACGAALADELEPGRFARAAAAIRRAPAAQKRVARRALEDIVLGVATPRFLTLSYSSSVCGVLAAFAESREVEVGCAESRPRFEGRRTAEVLSAAGARVHLMTDAALATLVEGATAIIVGADAVTGNDWINKVGTRSLAAAAGSAGVPVLVLATSDKFLPPALESRLTLQPGPPEEVWPAAPAGVIVSNPIFEPTPLALATQLITDSDIVTPEAARLVSWRWQADGLALDRIFA